MSEMKKSLDGINNTTPHLITQKKGLGDWKTAIESIQMKFREKKF